MTERERWVVYPLLFLALGAALRDKLVDRTTTKSIVCQELNVVDEETTGRQSPRVLARIGRTNSKSGGEAAGVLLINGGVEIVDRDLASIPRPLSQIRIGRTDPSPGAPAIGFAAVSGEVVVDGVINAKQYLYHNIPFMPAWPALPGAAMPNTWRPLQQPGQSRQNPNEPAAPSPGKKSQAQPPAVEPKSSRNDTPSSPAGDPPPPTN